jgi:hypothetical protein
LSDGATAVPTPARTAERRVVASPLLFCWLLAAAVTTLPHALAALLPPPGRAFVGTFHWIDDFHNYLSFVQQAENGRFLFENKLLLEDHAQALVNLEWWAVGRLSWLLGGRPFLAYRVFALPALAGLLWAADRALRRLGVPASHRLASLLLVATGGGLGGMLFVLTPATVQQCVDLSIGLFPFLQALANPHWLFATWILLEALLAFGETGRGALWRSVLLGNLVGLSRPYDFVLLVAVQSLAIAATAPAREWPRRALPYRAAAGRRVRLLGLRGHHLHTWTRMYYMPPAREFVPALGPRSLLALQGCGVGGGSLPPRQLGAWILVVLSLIVVRPSFTSSSRSGGMPALSGRPLARVTRPALMLGVVLLFTRQPSWPCASCCSEPHWHVPRERLAAARARPFCRRRGRDGAGGHQLYVMGRTACPPLPRLGSRFRSKVRRRVRLLSAPPLRSTRRCSKPSASPTSCFPATPAPCPRPGSGRRRRSDGSPGSGPRPASSASTAGTRATSAPPRGRGAACAPPPLRPAPRPATG